MISIDFCGDRPFKNLISSGEERNFCIIGNLLIK
jgi:hypothetical protein